MDSERQGKPVDKENSGQAVQRRLEALDRQYRELLEYDPYFSLRLWEIFTPQGRQYRRLRRRAMRVVRIAFVQAIVVFACLVFLPLHPLSIPTAMGIGLVCSIYLLM